MLNTTAPRYKRQESWTGAEYWGFRIAAHKYGISPDIAHYYALCRNLPAYKAIAAARRILESGKPGAKC